MVGEKKLKLFLFGRASPPASGTVWSCFVSNRVKQNGFIQEAP
jgi:hypothetical protein